MTGMTGWIHREDATNELLRQAGNDIKRLGHLSTDWLEKGGNFYSRCIKCAEGAVVSPRSFYEAPIRGPASMFQCRGRRKP
jgi:hypothetical protein